MKDFLIVPEFFTEIPLEAKAQTELNTPKKETERKQNKIYEINMQLDALSERLGLLPKAVNPKHVFDQMEKLSLQKDNLEEEVKSLKSKASQENAVGIGDFESFKLAIKDLLANEADPKVKTTLIQKVVQKIIIKNEEVEIYFLVGENHYKRELEISGSRPLLNSIKIKSPEKRRTSPLPVFHGNLETSQFLDLRPNFLNDAGSNSLKFGRESE